MTDPEAVLTFWFGEGRSETELFALKAQWWKKDPDFDNAIRERFEGAVQAAGSGALDAWRDAPRSCVAWVVLLDQFPRNLFRGSPRAFTYDVQALAACLHAQTSGLDAELPHALRYFLYMPMMHAEDVHVQEQSVSAFTRLAQAAPDEIAENCRMGADFARQHAKIIQRFGRFPHRNAILGRTSTEEEAEFLKQPGSSF